MNQYFQYLAGTGSLAVIGVLFSVVAEKFDFWHKLDSVVKLLIQLVLSAGVSVGATFLIKNPQLWSGIEDYLFAVFNLIITISANQGWHKKQVEIQSK